MDSDSHQQLTTGTVITPPAWCTLAPVRSHTTTVDTLLGTEGWPEMGGMRRMLPSYPPAFGLGSQSHGLPCEGLQFLKFCLR